jgi:hypothetical protein
MVEKNFNQELPRATQINDADWQRFLLQCPAHNLEQFASMLAAEEHIPIWIKEAVTFEAAHLRAFQGASPHPDTGWFFTLTLDALHATAFTLPPKSVLHIFSHDIIGWYASTNNAPTAPRSMDAFTLVSDSPQYLEESQYHLLDAIQHASILSEALQRWINNFPQHAHDSAKRVGCWLRNWIISGVLLRCTSTPQ